MPSRLFQASLEGAVQPAPEEEPYAPSYSIIAFYAHLNLPPDTLEFLDKGNDLLKDTLLLCEVLWIQRAHLGKDRAQFGAVLAGKLAL